MSHTPVVGHGVVLGVAIAAVVIASIPIFAYPFLDRGSRFNPYESRAARWTVYLGGLLAFALFAWLSRSQ